MEIASVNKLPIDLVKVSMENKPDILKPIQDLIDIVDPLLEYDWMIGGGFVRDWYQKKKFNDVDIYIFENHRNSFNVPKFKEQLTSTQRFQFLERSGDRFLDGIFYDRTQFSKTPRFQVQFLMWHKSPWTVLNSYDFDLSKFFLPFKKKSVKRVYGQDVELFEHLEEDRIPYATPKALMSIDDQKITFADKTIGVLNTLTQPEDKRGIGSTLHLLEFEKLIKRLGKFTSRGMSLPDYDLETALDEILKKFSISKPQAYFKSALMEDANEYEAVTAAAKYSSDEILENAIKQYLLLLPEKQRYRFLTSSHPLARKVAKEIL